FGAHREMPFCEAAVDIVNLNLETCLREARGEMAAQMAETDESVAHPVLRSGFSVFVDRPLGRDKVKVIARPGVRPRHVFVELDPEPRLARRDDIAFLPADRLFEELGVKAVPSLDRFEDQEIRRTGAELDVGCAF